MIVSEREINKHDILCLCLPTCEPEVFINYWLPSIDNLESAKDIITIAINFQSPWTNQMINNVVSEIESKGFNCKWEFNSYEIPKKGYIPFNKIRNDTAKLCPDALFYVLTDDDFSYQRQSASINKTAGDQYVDIVHYMLSNPRCGMVLIGGCMIRKIKKNHIAPVPMNTHITNLKGIFVRRTEGSPLFPDDALGLYGAGEERILAASRLSKGYYIAKMGFGRTHHYEVQRKPDVQNGIEMYEWDTEEIINNNVNKYIKDKYSATIGKTLHDGRIIDESIYYENGGIKESDFKSYIYDYSDNSVTIEDILKLL